MPTLPVVPGYQLRSQLGAGGMGVVYFATRADNDYKYAIKMLLVGRDASIEELARFRIEAEAYACLNHQYIIKIRDVGVVSGCPFIAMDYADNGCLSNYVAQSPSLDMNWRIETIKNVADALSHAHGRHILHRDLKPANILIAADGSPRVTDFGLVKFAAPLAVVNQACCTFQVSELDEHLLRMANENKHLLPADSQDDPITTLALKCAERSGLTTESFNLDAVQTFVARSVETRGLTREFSSLLDEMTRHGSVMGSPLFMSPEQAEGRLNSIGPHTDVYGLGATLYHLVTGKTPVSGSNAWEIVRNVSQQQPVPPHEINATVTEDLSLVIMKALDKQADRRYANMDMFSEDLERILAGRAPLARLHAQPVTPAISRNSLFQRVVSSLSMFMPKGTTAKNAPKATADQGATAIYDASRSIEGSSPDEPSSPAAP